MDRKIHFFHVELNDEVKNQESERLYYKLFLYLYGLFFLLRDIYFLLMARYKKRLNRNNPMSHDARRS